ncbi:MAG: hypothetical protein AMJ78_07185 [Omnitrophica WOR_2 bacterium SM23_29]|nr:MAG: hypothetical protein AMJ78_07185 [Omnitrophica WOR_2 bacterium SM23_29]
MALFKKAILFLVVLFLIKSPFGFAEEVSVEEKVKQLEGRIEVLERKLAEREEKLAEYESKFEHIDTHLLHREEGAPTFEAEGFEIGAGATFVLQGTHNANATEQEDEDATDVTYSADIEIGKEFEKINSKAFIHLEAGQGAGVEDELTVYSNVNRDADDDNNVRVTEVWYEQGLFGDKALLTFGKLDSTAYFDNNEVANDETTQFLGRIFRNSPAIEFPDNTVGIRTAVIPCGWLELGYGVFDADSDWEDFGDNLFNIGQVTFKTNFFGLDGNYRILGWHNDSHHTKWLDAEKIKEENYGFGLSLDQKITDIVTLFGRYGWQDPEVYNPSITATDGSNFSLEHSWSSGFQISGEPWGRENDVLAFAVGQAIPSDDYKKADETRNAKDESHFETYYNIYINDHLSLSPDFQLIFNPFGEDVTDRTQTISIYGLRAQVDF